MIMGVYLKEFYTNPKIFDRQVLNKTEFIL